MLEQLQQLVESEMSGQDVHEPESEKVMTVPLHRGQESTPTSQFKALSTVSPLVYAEREVSAVEGAYEHIMDGFNDAVVAGDIEREDEIGAILDTAYPDGPPNEDNHLQIRPFSDEAYMQAKIEGLIPTGTTQTEFNNMSRHLDTEDHRNGNNHLVARREMQENAAQVRHIVASLSSNPTSEAPAGHVGNNHESTDPEPAPPTELPPPPPQKPPSGGGEIAAMEPEGDDEQKASKPEVTKPETPAPTETADTELQTLLTDLEPYRAYETSSFYFIQDREAADQFVERLQTGNIPYGIEFGPGEIPSKLSEIDPKVPLWVAFEPDGTAVVYAMETVDYLEKAGRMEESNKVVYVQKGMDKSNIQSDIPGLQTVVYRNSDYREFIPFPDKDFVENGKRVVMINDGTHLPEAGYYQNFLQEKGIPKEEFVHTEQDLSHIPWDHTPESYVYDSKGELTSAQTTENVTEANIQSKTEGNKESNDTDNPPASPPPELPPPPPQKPPISGGEIAAMEPEGDDEQNASKPEVPVPTEATTDTELQTFIPDRQAPQNLVEQKNSEFDRRAQAGEWDAIISLDSSDSRVGIIENKIVKESVRSFSSLEEADLVLKNKMHNISLYREFLSEHFPNTRVFIGSREDQHRVYLEQEKIDGVPLSQLSEDMLQDQNVIDAYKALYQKLFTFYRAERDANRGLAPEQRFSFTGRIPKVTQDVKSGKYMPNTIVKSPNIMYDEKSKKMYIIDLGPWEEWSENKTLSFQRVQDKIRQKFSKYIKGGDKDNS